MRVASAGVSAFPVLITSALHISDVIRKAPDICVCSRAIDIRVFESDCVTR